MENYATPLQIYRNILVCPPPPQARKPTIAFDGKYVVLPFPRAQQSDRDSIDGSERIVHFSLKPRPRLPPNILSHAGVTKVTIDSFPAPPFGCRQRPEMARSSSNPIKLPLQVRRGSYTEVQKQKSFNARCA
jgi:hypothetical protein